MFAFISIIISYLITLSIIFGTKVQTKRRKRGDDWWCYAKWEDSGERSKWMVGLLLVNYIVCLIPRFNLVWSVFFLVWYIKQLEGPKAYYGDTLEATRIVYSNKFTKWLTKKI